MLSLVDGVGDELLRVLALKPIKDTVAVMARADHAGQPKFGKMLRHCGCGLIDDGRKRIH
jgi:hypothetical protein